MRYNGKSLFTSSVIPVALSIFIIVLLLFVPFLMVLTSNQQISFNSQPLPMVSDLEIDFNTPPTPISGNYTNLTYVNVSVRGAGNNNFSSFINWNQSLMGYWNFDYLDSSFVYDNSTYDNDATYVNRYSNNVTNGKYGNGFYFNGSSDQYLDCGNDNSLNITDEITIEAWFKEYETTFNNTFEKTKDEGDYGVCVKQTSDGGYIITGETGYPGTKGGDLWLLKVDSNGNEEWNISFDGNNGEDLGYSVQQTNDGGYIITGFSEETSTPGNRNLWLIKTNSTGYCGALDSNTWNKTFGKTGKWDEGYSVQQTNDGGYIITGYTVSWGAGSSDLWLIKTNYLGNEQWNITFGGMNADIGWSVQQTNDGGYIITGRTSSFGAGGNDLWLIKTNSIGYAPATGGDYVDYTTGTFNLTFGGTNNDRGYTVQQTNDGGFIIIGYTASFGAGDDDLWLIKTNSTGYAPETGTDFADYNTGTFNLTFGGTNNDRGRSIQQTNDGGYIITGHTKSFGNTGAYDIWLIKTNSTGYAPETGTDYIDYTTETFNLTFGGAGTDQGFMTKQTNDSGYIIIGNFSSGGNSDLWLLKTNAYGIITDSNNKQNLTKTIIGKGIDAYQIQLYNGTISGYISNSVISSSQQNLSNLSQSWNHIVLTNDGSHMRLYINGILESSGSSSSINLNTNNLIIGKNFSGIIDEIRIWNRTLSHEEINVSYAFTDTYHHNFTELCDNTYTYYAYAIDTDGNENTTENRKITIDTINPIITVGPTSSTTSSTATITWTTNESANASVEYGSNISYGSIKSGSPSTFETSHSETLSGLSVSTTYHYHVISYDRAGNRVNSTDKTFRTSAAAAAAGGGSSTEDTIIEEEDNTTEELADSNYTNSGDGYDTNYISAKLNATVEIINSGNFSRGIPKVITVKTDDKSGIRSIIIQPRINLTNTSIKIVDNGKNLSEVISKPNIGDFPDNLKEVREIKIYKYLNITFNANNKNVNEEDLESAIIKFSVPKEWIINNELNSTTITLLRLSDSEWIVLDTIEVDETETVFIFNAKTPGFSTFAVVGSKVLEKEPVQQTVEPETPWSIIIIFIISSIIILIIILFKTGYIYFEKRDEEEK